MMKTNTKVYSVNQLITDFNLTWNNLKEQFQIPEIHTKGEMSPLKSNIIFFNIIIKKIIIDKDGEEDVLVNDGGDLYKGEMEHQNFWDSSPKPQRDQNLVQSKEVITVKHISPPPKEPELVKKLKNEPEFIVASPPKEVSEYYKVPKVEEKLEEIYGYTPNELRKNSQKKLKAEKSIKNSFFFIKK